MEEPAPTGSHRAGPPGWQQLSRGRKEHSGPGPQHMQRPGGGREQGIREPKTGSVRVEHRGGQGGPADGACGALS